MIQQATRDCLTGESARFREFAPHLFKDDYRLMMGYRSNINMLVVDPFLGRPEQKAAGRKFAIALKGAFNPYACECLKPYEATDALSAYSFFQVRSSHPERSHVYVGEAHSIIDN